MARIRNLNVRTKLMAVFTLMALVTAVILVQMISATMELQEEIYTLQKETEELQRTTVALAAFNEQQVAGLYYLATDDETLLDFQILSGEQLDRVILAAQRARRVGASEESTWELDPEAASIETAWSELGQLKMAYESSWQTTLTSYEAGQPLNAPELVDPAGAVLDKFYDMVAVQQNNAREAVGAAELITSEVIIRRSIFGFMLLFILLLVATLMANDVTEPVTGLTNACIAFQNNFYKPEIVAPYQNRRDEFGRLSSSFNTMASSIITAIKQQEHFIHSASRFIPDKYLDFLEKDDITQVQLGDHVSAEMAIMFSDIRGFTTLSESMTPQQNFDFVNEYLQLISPIIEQFDGFIVKFLGDGMMALFPYGVDDAIQAGIAKQRKVAEFNAELARRGYPSIAVGIGIHTGRMTVGMIGEELRLQGDAFSDNVNLTSRIEGLTKFYGVSLIVSEDAYQWVKTADAYQTRFLGRTIVKGRSQPLGLYELFDGVPEAVQAQKQTLLAPFAAGLAAYVQGDFATAVAHFEAVLAQAPDDKAAAFYLDRSLELAESGVPDDWNGVEVMTAK